MGRRREGTEGGRTRSISFEFNQAHQNESSLPALLSSSKFEGKNWHSRKPFQILNLLLSNLKLSLILKRLHQTLRSSLPATRPKRRSLRSMHLSPRGGSSSISKTGGVQSVGEGWSGSGVVGHRGRSWEEIVSSALKILKDRPHRRLFGAKRPVNY